MWESGSNCTAFCLWSQTTYVNTQILFMVGDRCLLLATPLLHQATNFLEKSAREHIRNVDIHLAGLNKFQPFTNTSTRRKATQIWLLSHNQTCTKIYCQLILIFWMLYFNSFCISTILILKVKWYGLTKTKLVPWYWIIVAHGSYSQSVRLFGNLLSSFFIKWDRVV